MYHVLQDKERCNADPDEQRALTRHHVYRRNELSATTSQKKRQAYLFIEQPDQAEAIIICCDEKPTSSVARPCPISQFAYGTSTGHGNSLMNTMRQELESDLFIEPQVSLSRAVDEAEPLRLAWDA